MQKIRLLQLWIFYGIFVVIAIVIDAVRPSPTYLVFVTPSTAMYDLTLGLVVGGVAILVTEALERLSSSARALGRTLAQLLGALGPQQVFWYAFCSSVGEEMLFRGALQPSLGLVATSVLFGAIHGFFSRQLWFWSLLATLMGFVFGWLMEHTGSLCAPIVAHFTINLVNLTIIVRRYVPKERV